MQLFTIEQFMEMRTESRELLWSFAGAVFGAVREYTLSLPASIAGALAVGDWFLALMKITLLLGGAVVLWRLICRFATSFVRSLFD